jgi:hypothetical protein
MSETPVFDRSTSTNGTNGDHTGHDQRGRFTKGNPGGSGNPFGRQVAALRGALMSCITNEDVQEVVAALLAQAKKGNVAAARLILTYSVGKPANTVDPDQAEVDESQRLQESVAPPAEIKHDDGMADLLTGRLGVAGGDSHGTTAGVEGDRRRGNRKLRKQQARLARRLLQAAARTSATAPVPEAPQRPPAAADGIAAASRQQSAFNGEKHPHPTVSKGV